MRGGKERNDKHRKWNRMYFHNSTCSFSSYNPVISGVWEQRWTASINIWRSGIHHRPRSIETSSYLKCMNNIQSSLSQPTIKTISWPRSFYVTAQWFSVLWWDKDNFSRRPLGSFSNKVVTQSTEREGKRANGMSQLKISLAKPDVM